MKNKISTTNRGSISTVLILIGLLVLLFIGALVFRPFEKKELPEEPMSEKTEEGIEDDILFEEKLISILNEFIGLPYIANPLNEEVLYTEEGFNSTTLILSIAAKVNNKENPEKEMEKINYYPPEVVTFQNRNHFSSYRNKVVPHFNDITSNVGKEYTKKRSVTLNKEKEDGKRIIDINWEKEIELNYIEINDIPMIIENIPSFTGVMFVQKGDEKIGLDVRGEGILLENKDFVYASSVEKKIIKVNFLEYLKNSKFDAVIFYEFVNVEK